MVTWLKTALFRHFSTFSQSISPTILLQKVEKLTKNFSFLAQAPNPKQALMENLGRKFGLDIKINGEYEQLIWKGNPAIPRKGQLSNRWNYFFHGGECGFYDKKHQQTVQVVLSNPPEFGHIDAWFLMKYMSSTDNYKKEVEGVKWTELKPVIDELYESGEVKKKGLE